jgi:glucokinase
VDLFISLYGSQAGNLGLATRRRWRLVGGGSSPSCSKIRRQLPAGFHDKEPHAALMRRMPLAVILTAKASLLGAAHVAGEMR